MENETISGNGNYYIHRAIFSFHYQNRAVFINSNSKVLFETCSFFNNSSTEDGGSFYIENSECVLVRICCSFSSSISIGCAYYISLPDGECLKNYAFECSVSQCNGNQAAFYHYKGDIQISNMNTSYNRIDELAAYAIDKSTVIGIINFTTASDTISSSDEALSNYGDFQITKCNYLNNKITWSNRAIIGCFYTSTYTDCSFIENKGNYLFLEKPTINNCYFQNNHYFQAVENDPVIFESIEPLDSLIYHYTTDKCSATYFYIIGIDKTLKVDRFDLEKVKILVKHFLNTSFFDLTVLGV